MTDTPTHADGWQPIETAPRDRKILAFNAFMQVYETRWLDGEWPCRMDGCGRMGTWYCRPTHWMSLPEPPA